MHRPAIVICISTDESVVSRKQKTLFVSFSVTNTQPVAVGLRSTPTNRESSKIETVSMFHSEIRIYEILKAAKGAGRNCEKKQKERLLIRRDKIILPVLNLNLKLPNLTEVTV